MSLIFDIADNPITSFALLMDSEEVQTFSIKIDCKTSNFLRSETVANLLVEAKLSSDAVWTNIETTPIDLSTYNATRQTFNVRLTAGLTTAYIRRSFNLTVRP